MPAMSDGPQSPAGNYFSANRRHTGAPQLPMPGPYQPAPQYTPREPSVSSNFQVQANPQLNALMGEWGDYRNQLAQNTDIDAVNALRRMQALTDRRVRMAGSGAMQRLGAGSGVEEKVRSRASAEGLSAMSSANADLTAGGRAAQLGALQGKTNVAGALASDMQAGQAQALQQAQARMQWDQFEAERADRLNQQGFNNNFQLLQYATQPQFLRG